MTLIGALLAWIPSILLLLLAVAFVAFLGFCLYLHYLHAKYDHIPGPPRDSFLLGHGPSLLKLMQNEEMVHDALLQWSETYGPVYRLNLLHLTFILTTCPEATKEILMNPKFLKEKQMHDRLFYLFGVRFFGNGLVSVRDHDIWYKQRRIMDPAFSSLYLRGLMGIFNERAEKLMLKLNEIADSESEAGMLHLFNQVTLDVIAKAAFGVDLDLQGDSPFPAAIEMVLKGMIFYIRDLFFTYKPKNRPFMRKVREACQLLRTTGAQWINARKTAMQNGEDVPKDILTQIIKSAGKEENTTKEDDEFMLDNFVTFFIAGQETTANQLAFCVMELARHPEILKKVRREVDDVIGMKQEISPDDLGKLVYLSQVLKEVLRLYPTAPGTSRDLHQDMVINRITIPAGVAVFFSSYVTGRMDKFFKDPLVFDPDRFHPDAPKPYYCYYPFSLGARACLGKTFAQMEAKVVMAKLLQRFDFTLTPGQSFDILDTGTLRPKSGVMCLIKHRNLSM
ncbi:cholesterol 24-hydroxylase-like [Synchiropus picturatus]